MEQFDSQENDSCAYLQDLLLARNSLAFHINQAFSQEEQNSFTCQNAIPNIKKAFNIWKDNLNNSENFVKVHEFLVNCPEGGSSLLMDHIDGVSLQVFLI